VKARLISLAILTASIVVLRPAVSSAQAAAPVGHWATKGNVEQLWVFRNGTCSFAYKGRTTVAGRCTWDGTSRGGILTIIYPMPLEPGKVRENIVWVNSTTITVWGDVFHKV